MIKTAWLFIKFDKPKSIGAIAGTIISVFLIGQQCGIFIFLINAMSSLVRNNTEYVWVVDEKTTNVNALTALDIRIGKELLSIDGVKSVHSIVVGAGAARFDNGISAGVTVIGVEAPSYAGGPWNMYNGKKEDILQDGGITTDYFDSKALGDLKPNEYFEINGKKVLNIAQTKGVRAFGGGMYTFTTIERARYLTNFSQDKASAFLIEITNKNDEQLIINRINSKIFGVKAWNGDNFTTQTVITVLKTSGIAFSFGTLIFFAIIIGVVIIGLTLYSSTIDRIKDYGTLKAIGADNSYIRKLIIIQALIIGFTGYILGTLITEIFRNGIAKTGAIFNYPIWLRIAFFTITMLIALFGSMFAIKRITKLEPAQVFRG